MPFAAVAECSPSHCSPRCGPPPVRPSAPSTSQSRRAISGSFSRSPRQAKGSRIASTTTSRPTVGSPAEISSRTARATIQLPDQSRSEASNTSQVVKRMKAPIIACYIRRMPFATAAGRSVAYEWIGDSSSKVSSGKPTLVFLHEGLGSIPQWRDFPAKVAAATRFRALVFDRYGYGHVAVLTEAKRTVRFMHDEALDALPQLLQWLRVENPLLIGHSDGASIALIYAGAR